jgi:ABC-type polar amino acid transport system ATPase subunit
LMSDGNGPATPACVVQVCGLSKRFGEIEVLKDVDLSVAAGEKVAIIGPSGSGKTTLLRCVAHLERPTTGYVEIAGERIGEKQVNGKWREMTDREIARIRTGIGMVFQRFNLFPHLTALENVMLGPTRVLKRSRAEAEPVARELLRKVGLAHKAADYPERLSGGQQQRVAIARSLAMQPRLMLFDEATSALDPELIGEVLNVMRTLAQDGMTMLIVTHEMQFAEDVADRVIFMDHGRIVDEGPPHELFRSPSHPRTQAFLRAVVDRQAMAETAGGETAPETGGP